MLGFLKTYMVKLNAEDILSTGKYGMAIGESSARLSAFDYVKNLGYYRPRGTDIISVERSEGFWVIKLRVEAFLTAKTAQVLVDADTGEVHGFQLI